MSKVISFISCFTLLLTSSLAYAAEGEHYDMVDLQLRWKAQFQFAGYYAALEKGFYAEEGLHVRLHEGSPAHQPVSEVLLGRAQYAEGNSEVLLHRLRGEPLVALAAIFQHSASVLITRKDVAIQSIADLKDKKVMFMNVTEDADFLAMFQNAGIEMSQLDILPSSYNIEDLITGKVDVFNSYITNEPFLLKQHNFPYRVFSPRDYRIDFYSDILFTTEDEVANHPGRVAAMRRATLKGWHYAMDHPSEIIDVLINKYNVKKTRAHLEFEAQEMRKLIFPNLIEMGHMNPERWKNMADTFVQTGLVDSDYSLDGFVYQPENNFYTFFERHKWQLLVGVLFVLLCFLTLHWITLRRAVAKGTSKLRLINEQLSLEIEERIGAQNRLKDAKILAEQSSQAKTDFLSVMSHELRTPLHGIIGLLDLMDRDSLTAQQRQDLNMALESSKSLQELVSDILDISVVEAGKLILETKAFNTLACIENVLRTFVALAQSKGIFLTVDMKDAPSIIEGDVVRVRQVLINLVGNAVKFTEKGGVHIRVRQGSNATGLGMINFDIQDTGIGISEGDLERIFEVFTQVNQGSSQRYAGTGLGTSIAKRLVEQMGGGITVTSKFGVGSLFRVSIPIGQKATETITDHLNAKRLGQSNSTAESEPLLQLQGWNILLVEDDKVSQKIAMKRLNRSGLTVDLAQNGNEAWQLIQQKHFELILTDLRMPNMDGLTLTRKIRSLEKDGRKKTRIIGISAHALAEVQKECLQAGMDAFLTKPIEPNAIVAEIKKLQVAVS